MAEGQLYSLKWNNYVDHIRTTFSTLRADRDLVDVTLSCEGKKITAHKMLLSACSPYFKGIFKENPCQHPVIVFRNISFDDLAALIEFMYNGEVGVVEENLASFLVTAELLEVQGLTKSGTNTKKRNYETILEETKTASNSALSVPIEPEHPLGVDPLMTSIPEVLPEPPAATPNKRRRRATPPIREDEVPTVSTVSVVPVEEPVMAPFGELPLKTESMDDEVEISSDHGQFVAEDDGVTLGEALDETGDPHELEQSDAQDEEQGTQEKDGLPVVADVYSLNRQRFQRRIMSGRSKRSQRLPAKFKETVPNPSSMVSTSLGEDPSTRPHVIPVGDLFQCSVCGNKFKHYSGCSGHLKSHSGLTNCWLCGKVATNMWNLDMHLRVHKNVQCGHCGRAFANALNLKREHGLVCRRKKYKPFIVNLPKK